MRLQSLVLALLYLPNRKNATGLLAIMGKVTIRYFLVSSGLIFLLTGAAKLVSSTGHAPALSSKDPILLVPYRIVFIGVGLIEVGVAVLCIFGKSSRLSAGTIGLLATNFVVYRLCLHAMGYAGLCPCLGELTEAIHVSADTANEIMKFLLIYVLVGSYATLIWQWLRRRQPLASPVSAQGDYAG